ncbi:uncharacterized protein LOC135486402 [Lineus longissimus]|uniref:uncharacterized protein LOC135486402 n=1 Tax=Lineus longissimus TaxID=88925 RepID=UPI002B4DA16C
MQILFLLLVCVGAAIAWDPTPYELQILADTPYASLPVGLKNAIRGSKIHKKRGENSNWCCSNDQPVNSVQRSKTMMEMVKVHEKVKIGYTDCGFLGATRCSLYDMRYTQQSKYYVDYYEVPDQDACPDKHVKCCKGFVLVAQDNCLSLDEAGDNIDTLKDLIEAGLIGGGNGLTM